MGRICQETNAAGLLTAHPSRTSLKGGDPDGGSTAWASSARARMTLARASGALGEVDPQERRLALPKSNYSASGTEMKLRYDRQVLWPIAPLTMREQFARLAAAATTFMQILNRHNLSGREVSASPQAKNYAPKVFSTLPDRGGYLFADFEESMHHLLATSMIEVNTKGPTSRPMKFIRPTIYAEEKLKAGWVMYGN